MTTRALEKEEIFKLFSNVSGKYAPRDRMTLICGISMGLRAQEICQLSVGDVLAFNGDFKTYVAIRPETAKGGRGRVIRVGQKIKDALDQFMGYKKEKAESLQTDAPLFVSQKGGGFSRQQLFRVMQRIFQKAGIDQSPHCLRKTGATLYYLGSGYDLIATQQFLGHTDPSVTRVYIGLTTEELALYSEQLADALFLALEGREEKCNTFHDMLHFSDSDLFVELQQRGYDTSPLLEKKRKQQLEEARVVSIDIARHKATV